MSVTLVIKGFQLHSLLHPKDTGLHTYVIYHIDLHLFDDEFTGDNVIEL